MDYGLQTLRRLVAGQLSYSVVLPGMRIYALATTRTPEKVLRFGTMESLAPGGLRTERAPLRLLPLRCQHGGSCDSTQQRRYSRTVQSPTHLPVLQCSQAVQDARRVPRQPSLYSRRRVLPLAIPPASPPPPLRPPPPPPAPRGAPRPPPLPPRRGPLPVVPPGLPPACAFRARRRDAGVNHRLWITC